MKLGEESSIELDYDEPSIALWPEGLLDISVSSQEGSTIGGK